MVNFTTRIILRLEALKTVKSDKADQAITADIIEAYGRLSAQRTERVAAMMRLLAGVGFTFSYGKGAINGESDRVEAQELKILLRSNGFEDWEYQIYLEYYRQWGIL